MNIAPTVTSMGRSLISSAIMCFEMFLGNNVKFSSLNDILIFIDHVRTERPNWKYNDYDILDTNGFADINEVFNKLILNCGYKYIPTDEDMEIVYGILRNCNQVELNRLFYKNNLYGFMDNSIARNLMINIITKMNVPYIEPMNPPKSIEKYLVELKDLLMEYVFYNYMIMDRVDRNKNMIKLISLISDTDSSFVSLDAWYNYNLEYLKNYDSPILHQSVDVYQYLEAEAKKDDYWWKSKEVPDWYSANNNKRLVFTKYKVDEWGDPEDPSIFDVFSKLDPEEDYDFHTQEIINKGAMINPLIKMPEENLRLALINIMAYVLSFVINEYMITFTKEAGAHIEGKACRINMKNEFDMARVMLTDVKKNYAALQKRQEEKYLGKGVMDIKGIPCLIKSVTAKGTQDALKKVLLEDILTSDTMDQAKILKDIAIIEKKIYNDLRAGSKTYYKPATIKSINNYKDPLKQQGIKGSIVWNYVKGPGYPSLDLSERNGVDIMKVLITPASLELIKDEFPEQYEAFMDLVDISRNKIIEGVSTKELFNGKITALCIPKEVAPPPKWALDLIDYKSIVNDNIAGFPVKSAGISQMDNKNVNYTNVIKL